MVCAALEHPLNLVEDEKYFGCGLEGSVMALKGRGNLSSDPSTDFNAKVWNYIGHEVCQLLQFFTVCILTFFL